MWSVKRTIIRVSSFFGLGILLALTTGLFLVATFQRYGILSGYGYPFQWLTYFHNSSTFEATGSTFFFLVDSSFYAALSYVVIVAYLKRAPVRVEMYHPVLVSLSVVYMGAIVLLATLT